MTLPDLREHADRDRSFRRNGTIVERRIAGEFFLVPVRGRLADMQAIFALNRVGEFIWQHLGEHKNIPDICCEVVAAFEVANEEAETDVREFIGDLLEAGLIEEAD